MDDSLHSTGGFDCCLLQAGGASFLLMLVLHHSIGKQGPALHLNIRCRLLLKNELALMASSSTPQSPNLLIVEILKTCSKIDSFLGAHKWREFLKDPEGVDPGQSSRVYYCRYKSERDVQKHGEGTPIFQDDFSRTDEYPRLEET